MNESSLFLYPHELEAHTPFSTEYWRQHGLQASPFEDHLQINMYYPISHWQPLLKIAQEIYKTDQIMLLIHGEFSIGKSMFVTQFLSGRHTLIDVCKLKGKDNISQEELVYQIAENLDLPLPFTNSDMPSQVQDVINMLQRLGKTAYLVIDDADLLSNENFEVIMEFISRQYQKSICLHVILVCETNLFSKCEDYLLLQGINTEIAWIHLQGLNLKETEAYIKHRLKEAGCIKKNLLNRRMIKKIHHLSDGIPGRINRVAQQMLIELLKPEKDRILLATKKKAKKKLNWKKTNFLSKYTFILSFALILFGGGFISFYHPHQKVTKHQFVKKEESWVSMSPLLVNQKEQIDLPDLPVPVIKSPPYEIFL